MPLSQSELVQLVKSGNHDAFDILKSDFDDIIRALVSTCEVDRAEKEDLYQEGLIGLYKAAMAYEDALAASFPTFARICIKHSITSALRIYYGKKNYPIRSSLPLTLGENEEVEINGLGPATEPERLIIEKESYYTLLNNIDVSLSALERNVLKLFVQGMSDGEISERLGMTTKSVGNAIQRIRGKLKLFVQ